MRSTRLFQLSKFYLKKIYGFDDVFLKFMMYEYYIRIRTFISVEDKEESIGIVVVLLIIFMFVYGAYKIAVNRGVL